jgi:hypothetical protein
MRRGRSAFSAPLLAAKIASNCFTVLLIRVPEVHLYRGFLRERKDTAMSRFLKSLLFYPLFLFRGLARLVLIFLTGFCLLFGIACLFGHNWLAAILLFIVAILCVALRFQYVALLQKLNPSGMDLIMDI